MPLASGDQCPGSAILTDAVPALLEESRLLELAAGASLVHVIHTAADENGAILEVSESVWPADRIVIFDDYHIAQEPDELQGLSNI